MVFRDYNSSMYVFLISLIMLSIYFIGRSKLALVPSNIVFLSYLMYFIFPSSLYFILEAMGWEYVLPWGKLYSWSELSLNAAMDYLYVFLLFFIITRALEESSLKAKAEREFSYQVSEFWMVFFAMITILGLYYFISRTGGLSSWVNDYSFTYLTKKKGSGLLNFLLIHMANFLAMLFGVYVFCNKKVRLVTVLAILSVLVIAALLQGLKSRIFLFLIFFLIIPLSKTKISIVIGTFVFLAFLLLFSSAMYIRSNGFYSNPAMLMEYFLNYFNTIFLHDMILKDMEPGVFQTLGMATNKWIMLSGFKPEQEFFDISIWLTATYFPKQWYLESATQQWPLETELYLNFGNHFLWVIPILIYSVFICVLFGFSRNRACMYIYVYELLLLLSLFRGSLFQWIGVFNIIVYIMLAAFSLIVLKKVSKKNEQR